MRNSCRQCFAAGTSLKRRVHGRLDTVVRMKQAARFAHISDLHIGRSAETDANAARLCAALLGVGHRPGDRHRRSHPPRPRAASWSCSSRPSRRSTAQGRLIVVPGNHDCLGDDVSGAIMAGPRVQTTTRPGLYIVRVNSTGAAQPFLDQWSRQSRRRRPGRHRRRAGRGAGRRPGRHRASPPRAPDARGARDGAPVVVAGFCLHLRAAARARPARRGCAAAATWCCTGTATCRAARACSGRRVRCTSSTPARRPSSARVRVFAHDGRGLLARRSALARRPGPLGGRRRGVRRRSSFPAPWRCDRPPWRRSPRPSADGSTPAETLDLALDSLAGPLGAGPAVGARVSP